MYRFARGQRPQRDSKWAKHLEKIAHSSTDVFGRKLECKCGWHLKKVSEFIQRTIFNNIRGLVKVSDGKSV